MTFDVAAALLKSNAKKKRRYLMLLCDVEHADQKDIKTIERAVASALPDHTILRVENPDEALEVISVKAVDLIMLDRSLLRDEGMTIDFALEIKKRKPTPIFFFTKNDDKLIETYRNKMFAYEELDDYFLCPIDFVELGKKLRRATAIESRAAKRFGIEHEIRVLRLDTDAILKGTLNDVSMVGFGLTLAGEEMLRRGEQVQIRLPLLAFNLFHPDYGEFLRLSGRVKRLSLDGHRVGCSLEFLTPLQQETLAQVIEVIARRLRQTKSTTAVVAAPQPKAPEAV